MKDCYKPKIVSNLWVNNYIEHGSNVDKNRNLSLDEYLNKTGSYSGNITIELQNSDSWKIELAIAINFISSKDAKEKHIM